MAPSPSIDGIYVQLGRVYTERQGARSAARRVWWRWVLGDVLGETVGFGGATVAGLALAWALDWAAGLWQVAPIVGGVVAAGTVEGSAVGMAQWLALRNALSDLSGPSWLIATVLGAITA